MWLIAGATQSQVRPKAALIYLEAKRSIGRGLKPGRFQFRAYLFKTLHL